MGRPPSHHNDNLNAGVAKESTEEGKQQQHDRLEQEGHISEIGEMEFSMPIQPGTASVRGFSTQSTAADTQTSSDDLHDTVSRNMHPHHQQDDDSSTTLKPAPPIEAEESKPSQTTISATMGMQSPQRDTVTDACRLSGVDHRDCSSSVQIQSRKRQAAMSSPSKCELPTTSSPQKHSEQAIPSSPPGADSSDPSVASSASNGAITSIGDSIVKAGPSKANTETTVVNCTKIMKRKPKKRPTRKLNAGQSTGRWTAEEHQSFLRGLAAYGREWVKVALHIPSRSSSQVRSHAQKYFSKMQREEESWFVQQNQQGNAGVRGALDAMSLDSSLVTGTGASYGRLSGKQRADLISSTNNEGTVSPSVRASVARILAQPESVQAEVEDTMRRLRIRYRLLQRQLLQQQQEQHNNDEDLVVDVLAAVAVGSVAGGSSPSSAASLAGGSVSSLERLAAVAVGSVVGETNVGSSPSLSASLAGGSVSSLERKRRRTCDESGSTTDDSSSTTSSKRPRMD